jgi:sugar phosphate isomerase/epimerase
MMELGIFAKTFVRPSLEETLDAVVAHGLNTVQFNFACVGLPSMPDAIEPSMCERIGAQVASRSLSMAAVSGTFNMIHPDAKERQAGIRRLRVIAQSCRSIGTGVVTLCTGTRDPDNMWRRHAESDSPEAWRDLLDSMQQALRIAEDCSITLAFEPEVTNIVDSAVKARRLLDGFQSSRLKVVMDPANLFHRGELPRMLAVLDEAFDLLGAHIAIAHAKDLSCDGESGQEPAGRGLLDYDRYVSLLQRTGFSGALILHGLSESDVDESSAFLRRKFARSEGSPATQGSLGAV